MLLRDKHTKFISSRERSLRRRTLQDLIVPPSVNNSDLQNSYHTFRRSSVRVKLGLRFFDSLESLNLCSSDLAFESWFKSVVSLREFQSNGTLGVVLECFDDGVFEMS